MTTKKHATTKWYSELADKTKKRFKDPNFWISQAVELTCITLIVLCVIGLIPMWVFPLEVGSYIVYAIVRYTIKKVK